jgi:hypothetical protein
MKKEIQKKSAATIKKKKVKAIIAIGGNGTFSGIHDLCELLPTSIQVFFIPVTIEHAEAHCAQSKMADLEGMKSEDIMSDSGYFEEVYINIVRTKDTYGYFDLLLGRFAEFSEH